jgi:NADPH:quinone reductase-like Zn-dependent oxidoreductase
MKAAIVHSLGQTPQFKDFTEPTPDSGEALIEMQAAGLHPIVRALASGQHYSGKGQVPLIPGVDGVGKLEDGSLNYCLAARPPYGTMAQRTVAARANCIPLPENLDPAQAAAIANPGMSAWLSLKLRGSLAAGETVLVNGATGVAGQLAVQAARYLGARKVIATGRNAEVLHTLDADAVISLAEPEDAVSEAIAAQVQSGGIDLIIDYLWGRPTELLLGALARAFRPEGSKRIRLVEVGESAGKTITLPGAVLRSINLTLCGSGFGSASIKEIMSAIPTLFSLAAAGHLKAAVELVPLAEVEEAWTRVEKGKRIVFSI